MSPGGGPSSSLPSLDLARSGSWDITEAQTVTVTVTVTVTMTVTVTVTVLFLYAPPSVSGRVSPARPTSVSTAPSRRFNYSGGSGGDSFIGLSCLVLLQPQENPLTRIAI